MKTGIIGAKGFIGTHLQKALGPETLVFVGELTDFSAVKDFVKRCDRIYHLAGKNREQEGGIISNNLVGTANLVFSILTLKPTVELVFSSSQQVITHANTEYGFAKSVEEEIIKRIARWSVLRIPNVYGPGCKPFYNSVIATFCYQIAQGQTPTIHDPSAMREFIYIETLIPLMTKPAFGQVQTIPGEKLSIGEIASYLTDRLGQHAKLAKTLDSYRQ